MAESVNDIFDRCLTLTEKITATKAIVQESSRRNREAREDLADLSRQLSDLCDILDHWRYDAVQNEAAKAAVSIVSPKLGRILQHCVEVLDDVDNFVSVIEGLESWGDYMKLEIDSIYKLLDAYTLSLQVNLEMLHLVKDPKIPEHLQDTKEKPVSPPSEMISTDEVDQAATDMSHLNLIGEPARTSRQSTPGANCFPGRKILSAKSPRRSTRSPSSGYH